MWWGEHPTIKILPPPLTFPAYVYNITNLISLLVDAFIAFYN